MIISQIIENGNRILQYSDKDVYICQVETDVLYESAVDVLPCKYTYVETEQPIEREGEEVFEEAFIESENSEDVD